MRRVLGRVDARHEAVGCTVHAQLPGGWVVGLHQGHPEVRQEPEDRPPAELRHVACEVGACQAYERDEQAHQVLGVRGRLEPPHALREHVAEGQVQHTRRSS